ncbi:MAG: 2-oxoacid:ferredoxin oxidoreductase subunit beta, partial [Planctomycetes bacterium]|nr:2-oxoacid:ferredoxin oxidoreductase subunit beta [Planctomycetota bacterium]
ARWTSFHVRQLTKSIQEAILKRGFSLIEVISQCTTLYARKNKLGDGLDLMKFYKNNSKVDHKANFDDLVINFQEQIICGKFVDREALSYIDRYNEHMQEMFGTKFTNYPISK